MFKTVDDSCKAAVLTMTDPKTISDTPIKRIFKNHQLQLMQKLTCSRQIWMPETGTRVLHTNRISEMVCKLAGADQIVSTTDKEKDLLHGFRGDFPVTAQTNCSGDWFYEQAVSELIISQVSSSTKERENYSATSTST